MTAYTAWLDHVLPKVAGAGNALVLQAVANAVIEFCRRSRIYTVDPAPIDIVGDTHTYTVVPDVGTVVSDFVHVLVNGKPIDPATEDTMDVKVQDWRTDARGPAGFYIVPANNDIRLVPTPSESIAGGLVVKVALRPLQDATSCPDFIFDDYRKAIEAGALAELYALPRRPWANGALAAKNEADFNAWCSAGGYRAAQARTRTRLRTRPVY